MIRVVNQILYGVSQGLWISRRYQDTGISYNLRQGASGRTDHRDPASHGLAGRNSKTFVDRGYHGDGSPGILTDEFGMSDAAREFDEMADIEFSNLLFDAAVFFGRSYHHHLEAAFARKFGDRLKEVVKSFQGDIGTVGDDQAISFPLDLRQWVKLIGIDPVGNYPKAFQRNLEIPSNVVSG